ncbi:class I SAM-dependent methyltransferase [Nocardioides jishulii]|uniref:Methyltransferase domain-containing protein n=1 Tax=Nocardioides jishulii TaxID=2575440 RepID=A0A4U2YRY4_9ACTN|nr:class I SAM-dependent methyltransferase [Nocardioides jishulii]QCX26325.1 methyltransferase domain-containing protein [Nocardioides jishulii]TKI63870.1 methyltransferase domain-containing protein [Nocardioides jishulii]
MDTTPFTVDEALMARHRTMWATGDYPRVAREVVAPLGEVLVDALDVCSGEQVLDIAAGTGNAAAAAARRGADVTASDLTPELLAAGRAAFGDVSLTWDEANAEDLPYDDDSFDVTMSCIGVMFAPHHQRAADEMLRVARPGGRIGVVSWTPDGTIGQLFATMKPYVAAPPAGASPPPLWGDAAHVATLLGDRVHDVTVRRGTLVVDHFADAAAFADYFTRHYGPTIVARRANADDPERLAALDADLVALGEREGRRGQRGFTMGWDHLAVTATVS